MNESAELHQQPRGAASSTQQPVRACQLGQQAERRVLCLVLKRDFTQRGIYKGGSRPGVSTESRSSFRLLRLVLSGSGLCPNHWCNAAYINFFSFHCLADVSKSHSSVGITDLSSSFLNNTFYKGFTTGSNTAAY